LDADVALLLLVVIVIFLVSDIVQFANEGTPIDTTLIVIGR